MKKQMGKLVAAIVMFLIVLAGVTAGSVKAEEVWKWNGVSYDIQTEGEYRYVLVNGGALEGTSQIFGGGAVVLSYIGSSSNIAVPKELGGRPVIWIADNAFRGNIAVQTVTIDENIQYIGKSVFEDCTGLQTLLVARGVQEIGAYAFKNCTALKSATFQNGSALKKIDEQAFFNCKSLNLLTLPEGLTSIGSYAFAYNSSLTEITIPDSVISLGNTIFFSCASLREAVIGNGVTALDAAHDYYGDNWGSTADYDGMFEGCISLYSVAIGNSVERIGWDCFAGTALIELNIPDNVMTIDPGAFINCANLKKAVIGDGSLPADSSIYNTIGDDAFRNCINLETLLIGDRTISVGNRAFCNNKSLLDITIGKTVLSIGEMGFADCDALEYLYIPSNVTMLGGALCFGCDNLKEVVIGNGVTSLTTLREYYGDNWGGSGDDDGAFEGCVNLESVTIGSAVTTIAQDCFAGTALKEVLIPDNVQEIEANAFRSCKSLTGIVIGNGVTSIGTAAFGDDISLKDVTIGKGVWNIGDNAFVNCDALEYIYIPSNVTSLGAAAFWSCDSLKRAVLGNGVTALNTAHDYYGDNWGSTSDYDGTFEGCVNLSEVILGNGMISIGQDSFAGTCITSLTVPGKVSTLANGAFYGAPLLKEIYFAGNWPANVGDEIFGGIAEGAAIYYDATRIGYQDLTYNKQTFDPITVTFSNNDSDVFAAPTEEQILASAGGYVIEPIIPIAYGYIFGGWYGDSDCTERWDFGAVKVTADTAIYAKWYAVDAVAPERPEGLKRIEKDTTSITFMWSDVEGAENYNVYIDGEKINEEEIVTTSYTVTSLQPSTTYEFVVTAANSNGESEKSLILAERTEQLADAGEGR